MRLAEVKYRLAFCLVAAAPLLVGCGQQATPPLASEEEPGPDQPQVIVEIQGFDFMDVVSQPVAPAAAGVATSEEAGAEAQATATDEGAGEEIEEAGEEMMPEEGAGPEPPQQGTVLFKLLVRFVGQGAAPEGVDVEVVQQDAAGNDKGRYPEWVVTDGLAPGAQQVDFMEIEVDNYEDGDAFSVLVTEPVPAG